ncbi:MAG TPA: hypothetical protein IAD05_07585 [Candidatus Faecousia gallistercoris]|nr:hypothetical protein [Candidatus Faecousia gallistercoris]
MYRGTGCLKIEFPPNSLIIYGTENECSSFSVPFSQLLLKEHLQTLGFEAAPFLPLGIFPAACSISQRAGFSSAGFVPGSAMARNLYIERIEKSEKLFYNVENGEWGADAR